MIIKSVNKKSNARLEFAEQTKVSLKGLKMLLLVDFANKPTQKLLSLDPVVEE